MSTVTVAVEGDTDAAVARRLLAHVGLQAGLQIVTDGCPTLDAAIPGYAIAARFAPWLILRDLDRAPCAPALIDQLTRERPDWLVLRVPVREMESWLLADAERLAPALYIPVSQVADAPDELPDPKLALINLARRSTKHAIVKALVPKPGISRSVGPGYVSFVVEFVQTRWDIDVAATRSPSLASAVRALRQLADRLAAING